MKWTYEAIFLETSLSLVSYVCRLAAAVQGFKWGLSMPHLEDEHGSFCLQGMCSPSGCIHSLHVHSPGKEVHLWLLIDNLTNLLKKIMSGWITLSNVIKRITIFNPFKKGPLHPIEAIFSQWVNSHDSIDVTDFTGALLYKSCYGPSRQMCLGVREAAILVTLGWS